MSSGKLVLGVLAGVAIGSVMGILFAPEKGSRTRRQILNKGEDLVDDLKEKLDDMMESVTDKMEALRKDGEDYVARGKSKYDGLKDEVKRATV